ncbi:hypothetical protein [Paraburkholderia sp.]|jgi:hypothetical protein|uniref:hypothetical protein n=1 Tax=Paraburkholderia sp. TaxID=1926495 RepID=UPI002F42505C
MNLLNGQHAPLLTGTRNQCPSCGELFASFDSFDAHRAGRYGSPGGMHRYCLAPDAMRRAGMTPDVAGFWTAGTHASCDRATAPADRADTSHAGGCAGHAHRFALAIPRAG